MYNVGYACHPLVRGVAGMLYEYFFMKESKSL